MSKITTTAVFDATPGKVWEAIANPSVMKTWYFDMDNFSPEVGNEFSFYEGEEKLFFHQGTILKSEPNKILQHTWTHPEQSKGSSVVTWEIEGQANGKTTVTLSHEGVASFADGGEKFAPANYQMGWDAIVKTNLRNHLYGIQKLVFTLEINAAADKVWQLMWDKTTYPQWVKPFCDGTYFTGEIEVGSRIHFLEPSGGGMFSDVFYAVPGRIVIFKHIGILKDFKEMPIDAETEKWTGCFEIYKLNESNGLTNVTAEVDCVPEYVSHMNTTFPAALQELKKLSEKK